MAQAHARECSRVAWTGGVSTGKIAEPSLPPVHYRAIGPIIVTRALPGLALALVTLSTGSVQAQSAPHEYRDEIIVSSPAIHGASAFFIGEDHLDVADLNTTERQRGAGLTYAISPEISAQGDFRYINGRDGYLEHRYIAGLIVHWKLPADLELTARTRNEIRDIRKSSGPQLSNRLQERFTVSRSERVAGLALTPFVAFQPSYDSRYRFVNKYEELAGVRVPRGPVTTELFGEWWQDSRSSTPRYAAFGVLLRVST